MCDLNELLEALYECEDVWTSRHDLAEYIGDGYSDAAIRRIEDGLDELARQGFVLCLDGSRYKLTEKAWHILERGEGV